MSDTVSREEVRAQLAQLRRPHVIREDSWYSCPLSDEPPSADKYARGPQVCDCGADAHNALLDRLSPILLAALDDAERLKKQALKGELLDELATRGWMLMDLSNSTIVRAVAGDPRKPNREATGPNWRVRRNNGYYSYGDTPEMAILAGLADEANESTPKNARAGGEG